MEKEEFNKVIELLDEIGEFYKENDWLIVKKYILRYLNPKIRKYFSTRDPKSKKHVINKFDQKAIDYYYKKFNVKLVIDETKKLQT
tara:strand:- start:129 stop:386 length:258 start_codon:yes stop_codon:yes gene_type:complete